MDPKVPLKELIKEEYKKCAKDPVYFIRKYCKIQHPIRGRIPFDLYGYQEKAIHDFETYQHNIILKGRQIGISTAVSAYCLWLMLFHSDKNIIVIATKEATAKNIILKVRMAYDSLPIWLRVEMPEKNKLSLRFSNGSTIKASTAASDAARSEAVSLLILDEAAFIKNVDEIWTAASPTLSTGGRSILISTPNGIGNFFHRMYSEAVSGKRKQDETGAITEFNPIKLDWRVHPERDQAWRDKQDTLMTPREARQEHDAEFLGSGANVFDPFLIAEMIKTVEEKREPYAVSGIQGDQGLWIWENALPNKKYVVCADVARGDGSDWSAAHVLDIDNPTQVRVVAEYQGKPTTSLFGQFLVELAVKYNSALLIVERENVGWAVIQKILDIGYANMFYISKDYKVVDIHRNVQYRYYAEDKKMVPGFTTNIITRPLVINKLDTYVAQKLIEIKSIRLLKEMEVFIWEKGKAQAMDGYNDDLIMALGIGLWVRDTALMLQQQGVELTKSALDAIQKTGGFDGIYTPINPQQNPYVIPTGQNDREDFRWIFWG